MKKKAAMRYDSVWDVLADTPEQAANLRARTELMQKIAEIVKENGWTQVEAAGRCGLRSRASTTCCAGGFQGSRWMHW